MTMMDDGDDWITSIIPKIQFESMASDAEEIIRRTENGTHIAMSISHENAVTFCKVWRLASTERHKASTIMLSRFVSGIVEMLEASLSEAGIDPYEG